MIKENIKVLEENDLYKEVEKLISEARGNVKTAVNIAMVYTYYNIGKIIFEYEQKGEKRAKYGEYLLIDLSTRLTNKFGKGYSIHNLKLFRKFYLIFSKDQISATVLPQFNKDKKNSIGETLFLQLDDNEKNSIGSTLFTQFDYLPITDKGRRFYLSWSHYLKLMRIENINERHFYEIECVKNNWSLSELKRQYDSSLYERIALSKNKEEIEVLSKQGEIIEKPQDVIKDPYILEFLGFPELSKYSENDLEEKIISNLENFLLELGKGFAFVKKQFRITYEEEHFKVDLVFYNRILRCFVLFDLKIGELKHQDIGQMQMYVNFFDRRVKLEEENQTIGVLLCKDKKQSLVEMTLPINNNQIFASKYQTVLPSKEELKKILEE